MELIHEKRNKFSFLSLEVMKPEKEETQIKNDILCPIMICINRYLKYVSIDIWLWYNNNNPTNNSEKKPLADISITKLVI